MVFDKRKNKVAGLVSGRYPSVARVNKIAYVPVDFEQVSGVPHAKINMANGFVVHQNMKVVIGYPLKL